MELRNKAITISILDIQLSQNAAYISDVGCYISVSGKTNNKFVDVIILSDP
jgi:hypothetical protein